MVNEMTRKAILTEDGSIVLADNIVAIWPRTRANGGVYSQVWLGATTVGNENMTDYVDMRPLELAAVLGIEIVNGDKK